MLEKSQKEDLQKKISDIRRDMASLLNELDKATLRNVSLAEVKTRSAANEVWHAMNSMAYAWSHLEGLL